MPSFVFFAVVALILLLIDTYVLLSWKSFVRRRQWSPWLYRVLFGAMAAMVWVFGAALLLRRDAPVQSGLTLVLMSLVALWYLPKIPIVVGLVAKDILRFVKWIAVQVVRLVRRMAGTRQEASAVPRRSAENLLPLADAAPAIAPVVASAGVPSGTTRREFLHTAGWALAGVPFLMVGKGLLHTVHNFSVYRQDMYLPGLPRAFEGMTIAQLSDLHVGSFSSDSPLQEMFRIVHGLKPDMILVTGDWVNSDPRELSLLLPLLQKVHAPLGVYGSLGNHDHYMDIEEHAQLVKALRSTPVKLFVNENTVIHIDGGKLQLAGTDNSGMNQHFADLDAALRGFAPEHPTILMAHDPTFWDRKVRPDTHVDLMLSGHTHGGQFGVHLLGKELSVADVVYKQWAGLYREGDKQLYVNRGIGTTAFPVRVGIDPEITLFTLRKA